MVAARVGSGDLSKPGVRVGDILADQYRVEGMLGEGGMGAVYAVVDIKTEQRCALKVVVDVTEHEHVTRFFREGRATMRVQSDHVVRVFDLGSIDGTLPYMVMERLEGKTLKALAEKQRLDERLVASFGIQACEGLAHAHALGIVHRDVKPSNLFVLDGPDGHLKLLDFGISRSASLEDWERTATVTETHALLGSPHYVSPEQLQNPSGVDERADIWSLGVSMYYALSGKLPFEAGSLAELLVAVMSRAPVPLPSRVRVSPEMNAIVSRCLDRSLARRYRHVSELAEALSGHASPRWAQLVPSIRAVVGAGTGPRVVSGSAPPPAKITRAVGDNTVTVNEPIAPPEDSPPADQLETATLLAPPPAAAPSVPLPSLETSGPPAIERPSRLVPLLVMIFGLIAVVGVTVVIVKTRLASPPELPAPPRPPPEVASVAPSPPPSLEPTPPSPAPAAASSNAGLPQFQLVADAPITQVLKPTVANRKRAILEEGQATLIVSPFKGDLPIEVELAGGGHAKGTARIGGAATIHLTTVVRKGVKGSTATSSAKSPSPPASNTSGLHDSPYVNP